MSLLTAGSLEPDGPAAEAIADLWWLLLGVGTAVFVAVVVLLVLALFRRRSDPDEEEHRLVRRWVVAGGVVLPVVVLTGVLVATVVTMRAVPTDASDDALVVEVVGHQFWWEVRYPEQGVTTANELHLPVGRPVAVRLTSADVIHSFWVPSLAGKMDALPDGVNTLVLEASEPGEHVSECAEFCGLQHAQMGLVVVAEPPEAFASWVADRQRPAAEPASAAAERGRELFASGACADCHRIDGTGTEPSEPGPDLTHLASRPTLGAVAVPNTTEDLTRWVADPHDIKEGVEMPAAELSDEELDALVAYLETLE